MQVCLPPSSEISVMLEPLWRMLMACLQGNDRSMEIGGDGDGGDGEVDGVDGRWWLFRRWVVC